VEGPRAIAAVFEPVRRPTTFEETVERLGTAIRLGLLAPGTQLPPERELAEQLGIARSTLRQALTTLVQSGHLVVHRGRTGGTFVADTPPLTEGAHGRLPDSWHDTWDARVAVEAGAAVLAAERADPAAIARLDEIVALMAEPADFTAYRRADMQFHIAIAEAARSPRLVQSMTEVQAAVSELIALIPHPETVLDHANDEHARIVLALARGDAARAVMLVRRHLMGTEHILAGLAR
jgi:DNA-binding FadR family transcriptional regulator